MRPAEEVEAAPQFLVGIVDVGLADADDQATQVLYRPGNGAVAGEWVAERAEIELVPEEPRRRMADGIVGDRRIAGRDAEVVDAVAACVVAAERFEFVDVVTGLRKSGVAAGQGCEQDQPRERIRTWMQCLHGSSPCVHEWIRLPGKDAAPPTRIASVHVAVWCLGRCALDATLGVVALPYSPHSDRVGLRPAFNGNTANKRHDQSVNRRGCRLPRAPAATRVRGHCGSFPRRVRIRLGLRPCGPA